MNCAKFRTELPELLYGELPPGEASTVETHLAACPACRAEYAALRQLRERLNAVTAPKVHVNVAHIHRQAAELQDRRMRRWRRTALAVGGLAAAVLLVSLLRFEIRLDAHQIVLTWGSPATAVPVPPGVGFIPPVAAVEKHASTDVEEQIRLVKDLVHALARDVNARDQQRQQELVRLTLRLQELQRQSANQRAATERDLAALYVAYFGPKEKGSKQ
jgi:anti-sigma factor RsiW